MKNSPSLVAVVVLAFVAVACGSGSDPAGRETPADPDTPTTVHIDIADQPNESNDVFPDPQTWAAEHPQPEQGVPFHLEITFNVGPTFEGESIEVSLDGEPIVGGTWLRPDETDEHSCPNPYELILQPGTHDLEAVTGSGETLTESFDLDGEANALIQYRHPEAWPELDEPTMVWTINDGPPICE